MNNCGMMNPYGGYTPYVDKMLGNAYNVVRFVAVNMPAIQAVAGYVEPRTVAELGIVRQGTKAFVTDATSVEFGSLVLGGGTDACPVYFDGTVWRVG